MRKLAMVAGALLALALGYALAQPVAQNQISGNECWNAGQGPGGPSSFLCINLVRNGRGMLVVSGSGAATTQATSSDSVYRWAGAAPTTWTVTTPLTPFDGQSLFLSTDTTLTTMVTVTAATGSTLDAAYSNQTLTALTPVEWIYNVSDTKWYRVR